MVKERTAGSDSGDVEFKLTAVVSYLFDSNAETERSVQSTSGEIGQPVGSVMLVSERGVTEKVEMDD